MADFDSTSRSSPDIYEALVALQHEDVGVVLVTLIEALGSTPQDAGAKMLVTSAGRHTGTVGGGRVESHAIAFAQNLLSQNDPATAVRPQFVNWSLKGDVGMTCGGSVKFYFEPHPARSAQWPIVIFGAGHIAQALVPVLLPLRCVVTVCDSRSEWLERLPHANTLKMMAHETPADLVPTLPAGSFLLCMTKGHATDRPILKRALLERNFPFIGVIGSDAKAAVLRRELVAEGVPPERVGEFHCPLGLDFGTNHPHEIALSIAAQLLTERDRAPKSPSGQLAPPAMTLPTPRSPAGDMSADVSPRTRPQ